MKSFALDNTGDLLIENNEVQMIEGEELLRQTVQSILATNKGEWFLDWEQGIEFSNILGKGITEEMIRTEIEDGIKQVDDSYNISSFSMSLTDRTLKVKFTAVNEEKDTEIEVVEEWE